MRGENTDLATEGLDQGHVGSVEDVAASSAAPADGAVWLRYDLGDPHWPYSLSEALAGVRVYEDFWFDHT